MRMLATNLFRVFGALALAALATVPARAEIRNMVVEYPDGETTLQGEMFLDNAIEGPRPGVLVVHQWMGITDHERDVARRLAEMGYVAFVADIYGKGVRPANTGEASQQAGKYRGDIPLFRGRLTAALETMKSFENVVDPGRTAAIGYCFGGGAVLELARSGADVDAVVSFHGSLSTPDPSDAQNITATVLVCHGAADPLVDDDEVMAFWNEMRNADVDWYFVAYGSAKHSFTQEEADDAGMDAVGYNREADERSWEAMNDLFREVFAE